MISELPPVEEQAGPEPAPEEPEPEPAPDPEPARPEPKKRGRPAGAKNKPKPKPQPARVRTPSPEPVYEPRREDVQLATRYFVSQIANHRQALLTSKREGWKAMFN